MSQPEPNLTVVIPVHNAAPHLGACVESLPEGFAAENHLVGDHHVGFAAAVGDLFADRGPITRVVAQRADGPEVGVAERVFVQKYDVRLHILCVFVNCVRRRGLGSRMRIRSAAL